MMRNVNQACGVLALIAVGCLAAFGSAGDRIVSAAPGQIGQTGDTGQAIAIGGCNRCAWSYKFIDISAAVGFQEVVVFPRGVSGTIRAANWPTMLAQSFRIPADCFETGATGEWEPAASFPNINYSPPDAGLRFIDGLILRRGTGNSTELSFEYRLD